jgi:hypothetical protein
MNTDRTSARKHNRPRTIAAKAHSSSNPLKHGLTGKDIVLPNENPRHYDAFRAGLLVSLDPHGDLERLFADRIVADAWRLRRIPILEAALHRRGRHDLLIDQAQAAVRESRAADTSAMVSAITGRSTPQSSTRPEAEDLLRQADIRFHDLLRRNPVLGATRVLETSINEFANLWRHERALTRSLHGTLHELQRLQAVRAGEIVPPPAVIDLNLDRTLPHANDLHDDLADDIERE